MDATLLLHPPPIVVRPMEEAARAGSVVVGVRPGAAPRLALVLLRGRDGRRHHGLRAGAGRAAPPRVEGWVAEGTGSRARAFARW